MAHTPGPWRIENGEPFDYPSPSRKRHKHTIVGTGEGTLGEPFRHVADCGYAGADVTQYFIETYDWEQEKYTPQKGVRRGPYTLFGLRKALRKLESLGYCPRPRASAHDIMVYAAETKRTKCKVQEAELWT